MSKLEPQLKLGVFLGLFAQSRERWVGDVAFKRSAVRQRLASCAYPHREREADMRGTWMRTGAAGRR